MITCLLPTWGRFTNMKLPSDEMSHTSLFSPSPLSTFTFSSIPFSSLHLLPLSLCLFYSNHHFTSFCLPLIILPVLFLLILPLPLSISSFPFPSNHLFPFTLSLPHSLISFLLPFPLLLPSLILSHVPSHHPSDTSNLSKHSCIGFCGTSCGQRNRLTYNTTKRWVSVDTDRMINGCVY